jgi:hypothetical protein
MKFNNLMTFLVLHLSFVAGTPVDLSDTIAVEVRGLEARALNIVGNNNYYCWAISSAVLSNPGYATSLFNLHDQMFAYFNAPGNFGPDEFAFTSSRNNGVIWTGKVIVLATTSAFTIADAINDLYRSLNVGSGISRRGGTSATRSLLSANVGTLIEMVSMINGGGTPNTLKRDEEELAARASCGSATLEYIDCCKIKIE